MDGDRAFIAMEYVDEDLHLYNLQAKLGDPVPQSHAAYMLKWSRLDFITHIFD